MKEAELVLILGGARAGKSAYAEQLIAGYGQRVLYVATAEVKDEEMRARIEAHQASRSTAWKTLEISLNVGQALLDARPSADAILLDCITLLVTNVLLAHGGETPEDPLDEAAVQAAVTNEIESLLTAQRQLKLAMVVVSNEVGLGLVPPYPLGRLYRDVLGRANQRLAGAADRVYLVVAGLPLTLKSE